MIEGWAAAAVAVGVVGAAANAYAGSQAAGAAKRGQNIAQSQQAATVAAEQPYTDAGYNATDQLQYLTGTSKTDEAGKPITSTLGDFGSLNKPFTIDDFHNYSPAYQFQLQQGKNGVLNGNSVGNGSLSGAAMKDLTDYNQSAANTAWDSAFNQYNTQNSNVYSRLANLANLGQSAASTTAQSGTSTAATAASASTAAGNATANGAVGAANSLGNAALWAQYGGGGSSGGSGLSNTPYNVDAGGG